MVNGIFPCLGKPSGDDPTSLKARTGCNTKEVTDEAMAVRSFHAHAGGGMYDWRRGCGSVVVSCRTEGRVDQQWTFCEGQGNWYRLFIWAEKWPSEHDPDVRDSLCGRGHLGSSRRRRYQDLAVFDRTRSNESGAETAGTVERRRVP